jgi:hypothetical protein
MLFGNPYTGYGYSPDRSKDVDRFNPSTRANYQFSTSNPYYPTKQPIASSNGKGYYDGAGRYHEN